MQYSSFLAITATGFASSIGQVMVLRELLVLFYGNELSTGIVFACWLLWTAAGSGCAGKYSGKLPAGTALLPVGLSLLALLLPATLIWIRASRLTWSIPLGEVVTPGLMLGISLAATFPFCLTSGFLFTLTWNALVTASRGPQQSPLMIYLGEALGAALGGIFYYFVLLPRVAALDCALILASMVLGMACLLIFLNRKSRDRGRGIFPRGLWMMSVAGVILALALADVDGITRRWQWGGQFLAVRDTPYQNLAMIRNADQYSLFGNGLWLFSVPDPQSAENAVHLAMLQHPNPRSVLLISGGVAGLASEVLKHSGMERLDYVEPDPEVIRICEQYLPHSATAAIHDRRVSLFHEDAGSFLRRAPRTYDVVLLNLGDPMNAEMNRFFTLEFYERVRRLLNPGGILSFAVSSAPDMVGAARAQFLRSIHATVSEVFPEILVYPGEGARFLAAGRGTPLLRDPQELVRRIQERNLDLLYVREYYLLAALNPMRMEYLGTLLQAGKPPRVNRDFVPTCYFNNLVLWAGQLNPLLRRALERLAEVGRPWFWGAVGLFGLGLVAASRLRGSRRGCALPCLVSVMIMGGSQMVLSIVLLLSFQILEGFVYTVLALIISFFMAGAALGAGIATRFAPRLTHLRNWFVGVQAFFSVYLVAILGLLFWLQERLQLPAGAGQEPPVAAIFSLLALAAGTFGGLHFSLAVNVASDQKIASAKTGGGLYALDLIGAAAGALTASFFILPIYGLAVTIVALSVLNLSCALALFRGQQ